MVSRRTGPSGRGGPGRTGIAGDVPLSCVSPERRTRVVARLPSVTRYEGWEWYWKVGNHVYVFYSVFLALTEQVPGSLLHRLDPNVGSVGRVQVEHWRDEMTRHPSRVSYLTLWDCVPTVVGWVGETRVGVLLYYLVRQWVEWTLVERDPAHRRKAPVGILREVPLR